MAAAEQFLTFSLAGDEYALGFLEVREILELQLLTPVLSTPPWIRGVMNLRGSVVAVVDLALKLGLAPGGALAERPCIVIVETDFGGEPIPLGLVVDSVTAVVDLDAARLAPPPGFGTLVPTESLRGISRVGDRLVLVLEPGRLLAPTALAVAAAVEGEGPAAGGPDAVR